MRKLASRSVIGVFCVLAVAGCDQATLLNQSATFGPEGSGGAAGAPLQSGLRGLVRVVIENNTPFRALFSTGVFDNTDELTTPVFFQFSPNSQIIAANAQATLEGNSDTGVMTFPCARVFSVGSRSLIGLIDENPGPVAGVIDAAALLDGVGFSSEGITSTDNATPREGFARGFEALLGVDFNCGSLLHVNLEIADVGPDRFVVELFEVFPAGRDDNG